MVSINYSYLIIIVLHMVIGIFKQIYLTNWWDFNRYYQFGLKWTWQWRSTPHYLDISNWRLITGCSFVLYPRQPYFGGWVLLRGVVLRLFRGCSRWFLRPVDGILSREDLAKCMVGHARNRPFWIVEQSSNIHGWDLLTTITMFENRF